MEERVLLTYDADEADAAAGLLEEEGLDWRFLPDWIGLYLGIPTTRCFALVVPEEQAIEARQLIQNKKK